MIRLSLLINTEQVLKACLDCSIVRLSHLTFGKGRQAFNTLQHVVQVTTTYNKEANWLPSMLEFLQQLSSVTS